LQPTRRDPPEISCPSTLSGPENTPAGMPRPASTPAKVCLPPCRVTVLKPSQPLFQTGAPLGFSPSKLFPPRGAVPCSQVRCPPAVHHSTGLRSSGHRAATSGLCSPPESDTYIADTSAYRGRGSLGVTPLWSLLLPTQVTAFTANNPHDIKCPAAEADDSPLPSGHYQIGKQDDLSRDSFLLWGSRPFALASVFEYPAILDYEFSSGAGNVTVPCVPLRIVAVSTGVPEVWLSVTSSQALAP